MQKLLQVNLLAKPVSLPDSLYVRTMSVSKQIYVRTKRRAGGLPRGLAG